MTTNTFTTALSQASDAAYQAWIAEFHAMCLAAGLASAADTGQINTGTTTRPAGGAVSGFKMYYLNDTLHATVPIYIKFEFGSRSSDTAPSVWLTLGTGTNGTGTVTGIFRARVNITSNTTIVTPGAAYPSFACAIDGYFFCNFKVGAMGSTNNASLAFVLIDRTRDSSQAVTAEGVFVLCGAGSGQVPASTAHNFVTATGLTISSGFYCLVPFNITSTLVSGTPQALTHKYAMPRVGEALGSVTVFISEVGDFTQFTATPIGTTPRNYLQSGIGGYHSSARALSTDATGVLWE